jgi:actin-binding protein anillin
MTPKKLKHESKLSRAFQQSPAGPDAVRTTNFNICGSLTIDISTLQRNHWNLQGNNHMSPLEGSVAIKIQCSAEGGSEERGFLTMFDDVSGFGAWHRRWCKLTPSQLSFWMYPEDEVANKVMYWI